MSADLTIDRFLDQVEQHAKRSMVHRGDVAALLHAASARSMEQAFQDAVFHATFVIKTRDVMKRVGAGGEGFDTLKAEFIEGIERVSALLRTLVKEESDEVKDRFAGRFFRVEKDCLDRLLDLMSDLALIKHWEVDGHPLPFPAREHTRTERKTGAETMQLHLRNMTRAARLALVLLIILFIIDGPFTILGWVTALIVAGLLIVIQYEAAALQKEAA